MASIAQLMVRVGADMSEFNKQMGKMKSDTEKATGGLKGAFSKVSSGFASVASGIGKVAGAVGVFKAVDMGINAISSSISGAIARVDTLNGFPVILQQMGYSAEDAQKSTNRLKEGIDGLPTTLNEVVGTTQRFINVFQDVDQATETTLALNNAFLASGASSEDASRGIDQYVQMLSAGAVDLQSWKTLQETMPYALQKTAEAMGFTGRTAQRDLYEALKNGEITVDQLNDKFIELSEGTGGFAEIAKTSSSGIATSFKNVKTAIVNGVAGSIQVFNDFLDSRGLGGISGVFDKMKVKVGEFFTAVNNTIPKVLDWFVKLYNRIKDSTAWNSLRDTVQMVIDKVKDLWNQFKDTGGLDKAEGVLKKVGDALLKIDFVKITTDIAKFLDKWSPLIAGIAGAIVAFKVITGAIALWTTVTTVATAVAGAFGAVMAFITSPIGIVVLAIGALTATIVLLWKNWDKVSAFLQKSWEKTKEIAKKAFDGISNAISGAWDRVKKKTSDIWNGIVDFFKKWGTTILAVMLGVLGVLVLLFVKNWDSIKSATSSAWDAVKKFVSDSITNVRDTLSKIMSTISSNVTRAWTGIKDTISRLMTQAKDTVVNIWNNIKTTFTNAVNNVVTTITNFKTNLTNKFIEIKNSVVGKISELATEMKKKFSDGVTNLVNEAKGIPKKIGDGIKNAVNNVTDGVKALGNKVIDTFKSALGIHSPSKVFEKLGGFIIEGLKNGLTTDNIKSFASKTFSKVTDGALSAWSDLKTFFSGNTLGGIKSFFSSMGGNIKDFFNGSIGAVGSGVQRWRGVAAQALMMTGQFSAHNLERLLYQMQTESGGNPRAINLWDINAKRGIPSKGLMQVIDPTFQSYKMPGFNNIWNPLDNILASIRYAVSRYGSLTRAYRGVGYAKGGVFKGTQVGSLVHMAENGGDEAIVPLSHKRYMAPFANAIAEHLESDNGGKTVYQNNITLNATIREEADINKIAKEIVKEQKKMERAGGKRK